MVSDNTIAVIGDIHGCINTLRALYEKIINFTTEIYSVGDLVDRGNFSKEVVEFCIKNEILCVRGNHEDMLINAVEKPNEKTIYLHFNNGGKKTFHSYLGNLVDATFKDYLDALIQTKHLYYFKNLPLYIELDNIMISHAGFFSYEDREYILWNREKPKKLENKLQVFGHTPKKSPDHKRNHYVNIDTGCVYFNKLSAVIINKQTGKVIDFIDEKCNQFDTSLNLSRFL
jgi:serine/threonine protein phosphatase 1